MITEDYISFETAKLLKEKGFVVPYDSFRGVYRNREFLRRNPGEGYLYNTGDEITEVCSLQMAMKWLREVHHCVICITPLTFYCGEIVSKWGYCIWADDNTEVDEENSPRLESYEEACEAAIKYCLENLI